MTKQSLLGSFRFYMPARCKFRKHENVHTATGYVKRYLASVLQGQGKYEAAEEMNRRALSGGEKALCVGHPDTLTSICQRQ
jgi:hypothetical protein